MSREELKELSIKQLKAKCKDLGIQGYSRKTEDQIIDMILTKLAETNEADDLDELLDGPDESEAAETKRLEDEAAETKRLEDEAKKDESTLVVFKKLIKGAFSFNGKTYKGSTFELSKEEAEHKKIVNAIKTGLIETK